MLKLQHLTKRFGAAPLFTDLCMEVDAPVVLWAPSDTLLLDEPFTGMDPDTLQRAAALLRQRCAGKPVLLATHDESAIRALGWPVVELEKLGTRAKA